MHECMRYNNPNYLRILFPRSQFVFVARDEGGVMGEVVPAFHAEGINSDTDGWESGTSASDGRGAAGRAPAVTSAQILVNRGDSDVLLL